MSTCLSNPTTLTFHPFSILPFELRSRIWHHAASAPRNLDIWRQEIGTLYFHPGFNPGWPTHDTSKPAYRFTTTRYPPSILHVNTESRAIGLQYYSLGFGCTTVLDEDRGIEIPAPARIYVNLEVDRICMMGTLDRYALSDAFCSSNRSASFPEAGVSIAINMSQVDLMTDFNELNSIVTIGCIRSLLLWCDELPVTQYLDLDLFGDSDEIEFVDLGEGEGDVEEGSVSLLRIGRDELEGKFRIQEEIFHGLFGRGYIEREEAEMRLRGLQRRPEVKFGKLLVDGKSCKELLKRAVD